MRGIGERELGQALEVAAGKADSAIIGGREGEENAAVDGHARHAPELVVDMGAQRTDAVGRADHAHLAGWDACEGSGFGGETVDSRGEGHCAGMFYGAGGQSSYSSGFVGCRAGGGGDALLGAPQAPTKEGPGGLEAIAEVGQFLSGVARSGMIRDRHLFD